MRSTAKVTRKKMPVKLRASVSRAASRRVLPEIEEEEDDMDGYETREPNMKLSHAFIVVLILHLIAVGGIFGFNAMKNRQQTLAKIAAESGLVEPVPGTTERAPSGAAPAETARTSQPVQSAPADARPAAAPAPSSSSASGKTHEVAPGDTLTRIAAKYETTIEALVKANQLADSAILRVGQKLVIPAAATSAAAPANARTQAPIADPAPAASAPKAAAAPATPKTAPAAPAPKTAAAAPAPKAAAPAAPADGTTYEVVAGDNPYKIAKKFKVSYQALLDANGITDPTKLQIGQKLKIPAAQ